MFAINRFRKLVYLVPLAFIVSMLAPCSSPAEVKLMKGQTLYVPAYSHVYIGDKAAAFNLATTLSIRNTDPTNNITLISADYYNSNGVLVRKMVQKPLTLKPLSSTSFFIKERDTSGGFGASFIVRWQSAKEVNVPLVESIMVGSYSGQGISFIGSSRETR
jgi:hypothetical protein